jgi:hypothetical protein
LFLSSNQIKFIFQTQNSIVIYASNCLSSKMIRHWHLCQIISKQKNVYGVLLTLVFIDAGWWPLSIESSISHAMSNLFVLVTPSPFNNNKSCNMLCLHLLSFCESSVLRLLFFFVLYYELWNERNTPVFDIFSPSFFIDW